MVEATVAISGAIADGEDAAAVGERLGRELASSLSGPPNAVVLFASSSLEPEPLVRALRAASGAEVLVGASSAGEFAGEHRATGGASALALRGDDLRFAVGLGRGLREDVAGAARSVVSGFRRSAPGYPHRSALVLTDALAGHADELVERLTLETSGTHRFFGGGAGDDALFRRTQVFAGEEVATDAAVALEILSREPLGIGVRHGWEAAGPRMRVTEAEGMRIIALNGLPALEAYRAGAPRESGVLDPADPMPFFLQNVLGIETGEGMRLRVPLSIGEDGSIVCAADVPRGAIVRVMRASAASAVEAARSAARAAIDGLEGRRPSAALFFDCVATRLRLGEADFGLELDAVSELVGAPVAGCNTYGQVARAEGQFSGFHNCTAVLCVFPT